MNLPVSSLHTNESHFFHLYKNQSKMDSFKESMKKDINDIKLKQRKINFDLNRALETSDDEKIDNNCFYRKHSLKNKWSNLMMLAEWFMLVPESFYENYAMKFCPFGKHIILVSQNNSTKIFNKNGSLIQTFMSSFPGGGINDKNCGSTSQECTIFDCIFDRENGKFYLLDIIYFLRQDFRTMTAKDRFSWLENYISDQMKRGIQSSDHYLFEILPSINCDKNILKDLFNSKPPFLLDGLLFYQKDGSYVSGSTYSTMWLKPYMVPELLSLAVNPDYMINMPMDYDNYRDDIIKYNAKYGWCESREKSNDIDKKMDVIE